MRLTHIQVQKLYGIYDHEIPISHNHQATLIYGPNGIGKTAILRMLYCLFSSRFAELSTIPFGRLRLQFDSNIELIVKVQTAEPVNEGQRRRRQSATSVIQFSNSAKSNEKYEILAENPEDSDNIRLASRIIGDVVPHLERIGSKLWRDSTSGEVLSVNGVIERYPNRFPVEFRKIAQPMPQWLISILNSQQVHFIQTQRLFIEPPPDRREDTLRFQPTILKHAEELSGIINHALAQFAERSQSLDSTFPHRLLKLESGSRPTDEDIRTQYQAHAAKRKRLMSVGLLPQERDLELPTKAIGEVERRVLACYLQDVGLKLDVFNTLLSKLELFIKIINSRFLNKEMKIDRASGFAFYTPQGATLKTEWLSSGEQHEVVFAFELLFKAHAGSLILIDEPEISLHVTWQQRFIDDILQIALLTGATFIVATHSPQIIHDRFDLAVPLKER